MPLLVPVLLLLAEARAAAAEAAGLQKAELPARRKACSSHFISSSTASMQLKLAELKSSKRKALQRSAQAGEASRP